MKKNVFPFCFRSMGVTGGLLGLVALMAISGCGQKSEGMPDLAPVVGTVTMDGEPLPGVSITFEAEAGATSYATTDELGKYELSYIRSSKGAGVGVNTVRIETALDHPPEPGWRDPVHPIYNVHTTLQADVVKGEENVFNFDLESKPTKKK